MIVIVVILILALLTSFLAIVGNKVINDAIKYFKERF